MSYKNLSGIAKAVADGLLNHEFKGWFYGDSIGFEGLIAASDFLNDSRWTNFCHGFFRGWATRIKPFLPDDNTAPGHAICEIVERTQDEILKVALLDLANHLRSRRKCNGVSVTFEDTLRSLMQPYGNIDLSTDKKELMKDPGPGIYLDCMHFDAPFFAHLSCIDPNGDWAKAAIYEILGYKALLFNEDLGLYRHYWLENVGSSYIDGWGRGQGWALLGLLDVVHYIDSNISEVDKVRKEAESLARTMLKYQLDDGNWHSMVHEQESGTESSTAAFMATAFYRGLKQGVLLQNEFEAPANQAFSAMLNNIGDDGNLRNVSAAVYSALMQEHYWHVPMDRVVPWGQGPVLTAIAAREAYYS